MRPLINLILCIEDHQDTCELISHILGIEGYKVIPCSTLAEGFELAQQDDVCLIIIDVKLPDGSGIDFIRQIRGAGMQTPILVHSGVAYQNIIDEAMEAGANDYLIKPNGWEKLLTTVNTLWQQSECAEPDKAFV
jgi:DNA-binding response OmpR family regulator